MTAIRIGTRGSALALWQARTVGALLEAAGHGVEIRVIRTAGDEKPGGERESPPDAPAPVALKGLFVKEIEDALLREEIDVAVHSAKDMSVVLPGGLEIAAVLPREDPRDAFVLPPAAAAAYVDAVLAHLGDARVIGTSSVRRAAQLAAVMPRATFAPIRGNVDTRLRKLERGEFDGLVLAAAGLIRLGFGARITALLPIDRCVPAPGQGIVAIEIRTADARTRAALAPLNDVPAAASLAAERALVSGIGGGCQLPLGAIALHENGELAMQAVVASSDGRQIIRRQARGPADDPAAVGFALAAELDRAGARALLM